MAKLSLKARQLKQTFDELLAAQADDLRLRDHLEGMRRNEALGGLIWHWGPALYRRNRVVFREFIEREFSEFRQGEFFSGHNPWSEHSARLDAWLAEVRSARDTRLARRLLRWKYAGKGWGDYHSAWRTALLTDFRAAPTAAAKAIVLEEYDEWFELDEPTALALYSLSRSSAKFLLKHLPQRFSFWSGEKRLMWRSLFEAAIAAGDDELALALYRRQVNLATWRRDIEKLASEIADPDRLNDELRKHHPEGWGLKLGRGVAALLRARGRDVMPYVREKLDKIVGDWSESKPDELLALARDRGWWDLWAAAVRTTPRPAYFNEAVKELVDPKSGLDDVSRAYRLKAIAGVSREWNFAGLGLAVVHQLEDKAAVALYRRFPKLVVGPFRPHIFPRWWQSCPLLLEAAREANDEPLLDLLASRYATRARYGYFFSAKEDEISQKAAESLAEYYRTLRDRDEAGFSRRAAAVLTQIPAFAIYNYDQLLRTNSLARLLFTRSFIAFLSAPAAVSDLVEGGEIHVQMLAYRILAQNDPRARKLAAAMLDVLQGTLMRPLHRKTRIAAFAALANAARHNAQSAELVLRRAREALRLPDAKYPKEQLIGLIAGILHDAPELRGHHEQPLVFGMAEALA